MTVDALPGAKRSDMIARWLQVVLVLSLSINLLIAGAVLGGSWVLRHHDGPMSNHAPGAASAMMGPVAHFLGTLPELRRKELHDVIGQHQAASAEFNKSMAAVRHDAAEALTASTFDKARFEVTLSRLYDAEIAGRKAMIPATSSFVEHLTPAERAAFMQLLRWQATPAGDQNVTQSTAEPTDGTKAP